MSSGRPRLLDLFCGAGGASVGYDQAGFDVTGVDIAEQRNYPFTFYRGDALEFLAEHGDEYDAIHASPPCQGYSAMRCLPWLRDREYPMLIEPVRELLMQTGKPWVIENVERAPLMSGITLCGQMFGLKVYRHRRFESNILLIAPPHQKHREVIGAGSMLNDRASANANGFVSLLSKGDLRVAQAAMGIDWMTRDELTESIPPAYTEFIGRQLMAVVKEEAA